MSKFRHKVEPKHGTRSGYDWHRRDMKENPCLDCQEAERAYWKNQRQIRNERINSLRRDWRFRTPNARRHFRRNDTSQETTQIWMFLGSMEQIATYVMIL